MPSPTAPPFLQLRNVSKQYGGVVALDRVSFSCETGKIHAILGENGARKLIAQYHDKGMKGLSLGQSPGLAAIAMKAAVEALQGKVLPQKISVPIPAADQNTLKDGDNYFAKLSDNFFTPNDFPPCGVNISGVKIMNESETDMK